MQKINSINGYIEQFSPAIQKRLESLRQLIRKLAPIAQEAMKYGIPTFVLNGNLVHFAAFKEHIGFYPTPAGISAFKKELVKYKTSKGAIQFPLDKPLPITLIKKIVKFRIAENISKAKS
jgi:uncharacterized protein YdhG (YjbR/CyaY superfamily)